MFKLCLSLLQGPYNNIKSVFHRMEIQSRGRIGQYRLNVTSLKYFIKNTYKSD